MAKLEELLKEWDDPQGAQTFSEAEELISKLRIELAGKEEVIKVLQEDISYYKLVSGQ